MIDLPALHDFGRFGVRIYASTLLKRLDNREGNISEANDSFLRVVGYSRDELLDGEVNWKEMPPLNMNTLMKKP